MASCDRVISKIRSTAAFFEKPVTIYITLHYVLDPLIFFRVYPRGKVWVWEYISMEGLEDFNMI